MIQYSEELAKIIDGLKEISHGSEYEVEIRAATIVAVELIF